MGEKKLGKEGRKRCECRVGLLWRDLGLVTQIKAEGEVSEALLDVCGES